MSDTDGVSSLNVKEETAIIVWDTGSVSSLNVKEDTAW